MRLDQRGDTIIEVLLSTVVISIVIAGAYTLTNRATRINQTALERTTVSNIMREQIELIRGARTAGPETDVWTEVSGLVSTGGGPDYDNCTAPSNAFYMSPDLDNYRDDSFVLDYDGSINYGNFFRVWVEGYQPTAASGYIDFHVRACWEGIGGEEDQRSSLVMRITQ